jgi:hypothetical protein
LDPRYALADFRRWAQLRILECSGFGLHAFADAEDVAVGVADVHFAGAPGHICRRESDVEARGDALLLDSVHVRDPDGHPDALIAVFVTIDLKGGGVGATAAASLTALAKKKFRIRRSRPRQKWEEFPNPNIFSSPIFQTRRSWR